MGAKLSQVRGRPRGFDPERALTIGLQMFHASGLYDAVGLAALTDAVGIKAPSFYKAFGSKAHFFETILERYSQSVLTLDDVLVPGRHPVDALADLLERAAMIYARDPAARGCLVLETARGRDDNEGTILARAAAQKRREAIRCFVAGSHADRADCMTDYIASTMSGLSAMAREGMDEKRLAQVAKTSIAGLRAIFSEPV